MASPQEGHTRPCTHKIWPDCPFTPNFPTLRGDAANMARYQSADAAHGALTTWRHAGGMPARVIACFGGWAAGGCLGTSCAFLIHEASS